MSFISRKGRNLGVSSYSENVYRPQSSSSSSSSASLLSKIYSALWSVQVTACRLLSSRWPGQNQLATTNASLNMIILATCPPVGEGVRNICSGKSLLVIRQFLFADQCRSWFWLQLPIWILSLAWARYPAVKTDHSFLSNHSSRLYERSNNMPLGHALIITSSFR